MCSLLLGYILINSVKQTCAISCGLYILKFRETSFHVIVAVAKIKIKTLFWNISIKNLQELLMDTHNFAS